MSTAGAFFETRFIPQNRHLSVRTIAILCLAVALVCATIVFTALSSFGEEYPVSAVHEDTTPAAASEVAAPVTTHNDGSVTTVRVPDHRTIEFKLARTRRFQSVGPIQIGVWRTDAKHESAQLSILAGRHRSDYKRVFANQRLLIPARTQVFELTINRITKTEVSGDLTEIVSRSAR